jgi:hypothetical protein
VKVQQQDLFHGAALTQIVEHPSFKALNRASTKYGHYLINTNRQIFVNTGRMTHLLGSTLCNPMNWRRLPPRSRPRTTFSSVLFAVLSPSARSTETRLTGWLISPARFNSGLRSTYPPRGSCHLSGSKGHLKPTVHHKAFPDKIFS